MSEAGDEPTCECGHVEVAHELVTREGKAWFSVDGMEMTAAEVHAAANEGRLFRWCGHCDDGCAAPPMPDAPLPRSNVRRRTR